jgi:hypothetical protein
VEQRNRVRISSSCTCGRWRLQKERSCKSCACSPARVNQVVMVAGRKPKTREAADGSNPSGSRREHHRDPAREGVFRRYKGVSRRRLQVVWHAWHRNLWICSAWPCLPSPTRAWTPASLLPKYVHCRFGQAKPSVGMRVPSSTAAFHLAKAAHSSRRWPFTRRGRGAETTGRAIVWRARRCRRR